MSANKFRLSNQAIGSLMLALQKCLMAANNGKSKEECDITGVLSNFELEDSKDGLIVMNPPTVDFGEEIDLKELE